MPPKPKFTQEEIVAAALALVREQGMSALTARSLGQQLGSSARPIFTVFENMEQVQQAVRRAAAAEYDLYCRRALSYTPAFKQFGVEMVRFAADEPKLFQLLFMDGSHPAQDFFGLFRDLEQSVQTALAVVERDYALNRQDAETLFQQVWIHTFGICVMCARGVCRFSDAQINELLGQHFLAALEHLRPNRARG